MDEAVRFSIARRLQELPSMLPWNDPGKHTFREICREVFRYHGVTPTMTLELDIGGIIVRVPVRDGVVDTDVPLYPHD